MRRILSLLSLLCAANLAAATSTWTGAAGNNWTIATNWKEGGAPVAGDDLVFPASGANQQTTNNDFPANTSFNSIAFTGGSYRLGGNAITIGAGGIHTTHSAGGTDSQFHSIHMPVTLGASQTWFLVTEHSAVALDSPLNLNGKALAIVDNGNTAPTIESGITGSGSISLTGSGTGFNLHAVSTSTAPFTITNDALFLRGTYLGPILLGDSAELDDSPGATAGTVTATGPFAVFAPGTDFPANGTANSGNVILAPATEFDAAVNSPTDFSQLKLTGTIDLGGADLSIRAGDAIVPVGTTVTIIDNDGSDAVTGTFRGLPEGAGIVTDFRTLQVFRVSYVGGTGNDVVLTAAGPGISTDLTVTSSLNPSTPGQAVTLTAKVTADSGIPTGSVVIEDFSSSGPPTILATVPLDASGKATFTASSLSPGPHFLEVDYGPTNPPFAPSSGFLEQDVSGRRRAVKR